MSADKNSDIFNFVSVGEARKVTEIVTINKSKGGKNKALNKSSGEKKLVKYVLGFLKKLDLTSAKKVHGSIYSAKEPDIDCIMCGFSFKIELKDYDILLDKDTAQYQRLVDYARKGCGAFWANSEIMFLENLKKRVLQRLAILGSSPDAKIIKTSLNNILEKIELEINKFK